MWNNSGRVNHTYFVNKMTHPHPNRRFVQQAVLTRSGKINNAGASVNTAVKDTTARDRAVVSENKGKEANVVKASIQVYNGLDPQKSLILLFYVHGNPQQKEYREKGVFDSGCSRHMTGNKCYLTEYEDYDGGFVSFGDGKGRISGPKDSEEDAGVKPTEVDESKASDKDGKDEQDSRSEFKRLLQKENQTEHPNSTNSINTVSTPVSTDEPSSTNDAPSSPLNAAKTSKEHLFEQFSPFKNAFTLPNVPNVSPMNDNTRIFDGAYDDEDVGG
ncbi:hypothetical protein Tco_1335119 [Tanacetum coccineum]